MFWVIINPKESLQMSIFPDELSLLALRGVVLMPRAYLPIPIVDAGQAAMVAACLQTKGKLIGIVQSLTGVSDGHMLSPLFSTGCLGKIVEFGPAQDKHLMVLMKGMCRFDIVEELTPIDDQRRARVSYDRYPIDVVENVDFPMDRDRLMRSLKFYFNNNAIKTDWDELENASNDQLLNGLSMACPFLPQEKQALLESPTPMELSKMMTTLIEMAMLDQNAQSVTCH